MLRGRIPVLPRCTHSLMGCINPLCSPRYSISACIKTPARGGKEAGGGAGSGKMSLSDAHDIWALGSRTSGDGSLRRWNHPTSLAVCLSGLKYRSFWNRLYGIIPIRSLSVFFALPSFRLVTSHMVTLSFRQHEVRLLLYLYVLQSYGRVVGEAAIDRVSFFLISFRILRLKIILT